MLGEEKSWRIICFYTHLPKAGRLHNAFVGFVPGMGIGRVPVPRGRWKPCTEEYVKSVLVCHGSTLPYSLTAG